MPTGELEPWMLAFQRRIIPIMRKSGYYVFEYRNSHKCTKGGPGFESAQPYACRWQGRLIEEGSCEGGAGFRPSVVPAGTPGSVLMGSPPDVFGMRTDKQKYPLIEMCMGTEYWRRKLLDIVMPCPAYGLIGNYLDQIAQNVNASRCDAVGHGHPLRGGDWYVRAHEQVLGDIIRHYRTMGVDRPLLSHESFCEPLLGLVGLSEHGRDAAYAAPAAGSGHITASAWRDPAGTTAIFFSNQTGQPRRLIFDPGRYLPGRRWKARLDNRRPIELPGGDQHVDRDLAPDQTLVFETSR